MWYHIELFREALMRKLWHAATAILLLIAVATDAAGQGTPLLPQKTQEEVNRGPGDTKPSVTVFDRLEVQSILGREVRGDANENMGRIVDIIVDRGGQVRAAIIDFGGFLGVGNRKVAVAWNALRFPSEPKEPKKPGVITLDLNREQVQAAPEYKEDKPVVVLGASGGLESLPFP
jgi:PRC-barrel domain